ncbi:MAG: CocE/NonD family hydrolase [Eggerthellaceae bacterium]|jgi:predicted acyl esterase
MYVNKKYRPKQLLERVQRFKRPRNIQATECSSNMVIERDVHVPMSDGSYLSANVYRPNLPGRFPVVLCLHPGGKDILWKDDQPLFPFRFARQPGHICISDETSFEAPDPNFWVPNGYTFINIDKRGFGISPKGDAPQMYWGPEEIDDICDAIEWAGEQSWSNGNVGMLGVSYLAMNQYATAARHPRHLKAIIPWEGAADLYRHLLFYGGIPEIGFANFVFGRVSQIGYGVSLKKLQEEHPTRDEFWKSLEVDFSQIDVPMLNCLNFATQMLHARGSAQAFRESATKDKWMFTHRTGEWTTYYSPEANALMRKFFDRFLKGADNGMEKIPRVRLEIREFKDRVKEVRYEDEYPPKNVEWTQLCLDVDGHSLHTGTPARDACAEFDLRRGSLQFSYRFDCDAEIVGPMVCTLYIELLGCEDAYLFAGAQKFHNGEEVEFEGAYGFANDVVTKGAIRCALRKAEQDKEHPYLVHYSFDEPQPIKPGQVAKVVISLENQATYYRKGDELRFTIQGRNLISGKIIHQPFNFPLNEKGACRAYTTKEHCSTLLVPFIRK